MKDLPTLLDRLEWADGTADPVPSGDGWEVVLAENVAYLFDNQRRWRAVADLRRRVELAPEAAASAQLTFGVPAHQLLRRHGQVICRRKDPDCPSAGHPPPLLY